MKNNILSVLLCLLLISVVGCSNNKPISIKGMVDNNGIIVNYNDNFETNIKDEILIKKVLNRVDMLAWPEIFYDCSSANDIPVADILKYIEYVSPNYYSLPLEEYQKSPYIVLDYEQIRHITQSEFGDAYDLNNYGDGKEEMTLECNTAKANMLVGALPLKISKSSDYIDATVLICNNTSNIIDAMKYRFKVVGDTLIFDSAIQLGTTN